jgi:hypothetical protein
MQEAVSNEMSDSSDQSRPWNNSRRQRATDITRTRRYKAALEADAACLPHTFGQDKVPFMYAQPDAKLVKGIAKPQIENSVNVEFVEWPKSLKDIATQLGVSAEK